MRNQTSCQRKLAVQSDGRETSEAESRCLMRRRSTEDDDDDADVTSRRPTSCDLDTTEMQATSQHSAANLRSLFCTASSQLHFTYMWSRVACIYVFQPALHISNVNCWKLQSSIASCSCSNSHSTATRDSSDFLRETPFTRANTALEPLA